jgi:hypothetical protein
MKKRVLLVLVLMAALVLGGSLIAWADSYGKLTGGMYFVADWGDKFEVWQEYNVHETEPWENGDGIVHNARGHIDYKIFEEGLGWRRVKTTPICVAFSEDPDGTPMATVVVRLDRVEGWGWGEPGEHSKFFIRDGGTPGSNGDQWNMEYYQVRPEWIEFWPVDVPPPDCVSNIPENRDFWWDISRGNLVIHQ